MTKLTLPWTWQGRFLRALAKTGNVAEACRAAGIDRLLAYRYRPTVAHRQVRRERRENGITLRYTHPRG